MEVLQACMYVYHMVPMEVRQGIRSSETGVTDFYEPLYCYWELNMSPMPEQQVPVTTELSL